MNTLHLIKGKDAKPTAKRKSRYGHRDWFVWEGKDGETYAAIASSETCKMAMLAIGTQGFFVCYEGSTGRSHLLTWPLASKWLKTLKFMEGGGV